MIRRLSMALMLPALLAAGPPAALSGGNVTTLRLESRGGNTELTVEIAGGDVRWTDFKMGGPPRVVVDIAGARSALPSQRFDGLNRGGVASVRASQFTDDVVRVVMVLDRQADYTVTRVPEGIRIAVASASQSAFQPWHSGAPVQPWRRPGSAEETSARADAAPAAPVRTAAAPMQSRPAQNRPGRRMTVTFDNMQMQDVIASFAAFSGRSIIPGAGVGGIVVTSATINNQPWDEALRALLQAYGLAAVELPSGIIRVDAIEKLAEREKQEPLVTQPFRINFVPVAEMEATIKPLLTDRGQVATNPSTNTLIITDVAGVLDGLSRLVGQLDVPTAQVAIQAKIVFINRTDAEQLGVSYDLKDSRGNQLNQLVAVPDPNNPGSTTNTDLVSLGGNSIAALGNANNRVSGATLSTVISLVLGRYTLVTFLDALQTAQLSDVQAAPVVTTVSNHEASIWVGEKTPIRVVDLGQQGQAGAATGAAGGQATRATAQLVETGIRLIVTPQVTSDRRILLQLHAERSSANIVPTEIGVQFLQQQGDTRVLVNDGETAVIGGLTVTEVTSVRSGIPFLMDIPFIGGIFRKTTSQEDKRDLLIMVTPHIVDDRA
ncbi:MAG TPA: AMIN domain-containing protein [Longimicrobiaceae bacterium]|jgi:type IV pilus assembly protein PilQ|nr:AMIN domain-containing protein [Longimicrobiaceae bacterium]